MSSTTQNTTVTPVRVPTHQIEKAVSALQQYIKKKNDGELNNANASKPKNLFGGSEDQVVMVQFNLTEIPPKDVHKGSRIKLPVPFYPHSDVCVFVKDDDEDKRKKNHHKKRKLWKNMVKGAGIKGVKKVISLQKLKTEFKSYEQKRKLASSFDLFLCDSKIIESMPRELGNIFYKNSHKQPLTVKILHPQQKTIDNEFGLNGMDDDENDNDSNPVSKDLKHCTKDIEEAIHSTILRVPSGPTIGVRAGKCSMDKSDLVQNIDAILRQGNGVLRQQSQKLKSSANLAMKKNGGMDLEVKSVHITATDCISLPIYEKKDLISDENENSTTSMSSTQVQVEVKKKLLERRKVNKSKKSSESDKKTASEAEAEIAAKEALNKIVSDAKKGNEEMKNKAALKKSKSESSNNKPVVKKLPLLAKKKSSKKPY